MQKKIFIIQLVALILVGAGWYFLWFERQEKKLLSEQGKLEQISDKLKNARNANINIRHIEEKFKEQQARLDQEKSKFIRKDQLTIVTSSMNSFAGQYDVRLMDFTSTDENFMLSGQTTKVIALPIMITVHGDFINIGRYIENWPTLPFYVIPEMITISRLQEGQNLLQAQISARLYTWND
jgi:Tfp pilus assembly protein PilO